MLNDPSLVRREGGALVRIHAQRLVEEAHNCVECGVLVEGPVVEDQSLPRALGQSFCLLCGARLCANVVCRIRHLDKVHPALLRRPHR